MTPYEILNHEFDSQIESVKSADEVILYGKTEIATIFLRALPSLGVKAPILVFDNGDFVNGQSSSLTLKCVVILCGKRKYTRECMMVSCNEYFNGCEILGWHTLYFGYITSVIRRRCDYRLLAETILKMPDEQNTIESLCCILTTKCTLSCVDCDMGCVFVKKPADEPVDLFNKRLNKITAFKPVSIIVLQGGEVLLHKQFPQIIYDCAKNPGIGVITIATNGTLIPSDEVCLAAKASGVMFRISDYGELSVNYERLVERLNEYDIPWEWYPRAEVWFTQGEMFLHGRDEKTNRECAARCFFNGNTVFFDGKVVPCDRTCTALIMGKNVYSNAVDVDNDFKKIDIDSVNNRENLWQMCDYCDYPMTIVEPAMQLIK